MDWIGTSEERDPLWLGTVLKHNGSDHRTKTRIQFLISHGNGWQLFIFLPKLWETKQMKGQRLYSTF